MNMNSPKLKTPRVGAIIFGLIVAIVLTVSHIPPGFALVAGIIFGIVAFVVLDESKKEK